MGCGKTASYPDPGVASAAGIAADLANYPTNYLVNAAAATGGKVSVGGKNYDFTGLGNADTAAKVSDQMAATLLAIQQQYSGAQIAERIKELQISDPQGYAGRKQLFDQIMAAAQASPDRPLATDLQNSVMSELSKGGTLDALGRQQVQQQVRGGQVGRGITLGNAAAEQEAKGMVSAADQMEGQRQLQAQQFLQSGVSPEDVEYRRMQQSLANLGSFVNGTTPLAQFKNLSGAQNGATPIYSAPSNPAQFNPNAAAIGLGDASAMYSGQVNWNQNQVNPYMAGLSTGISTIPVSMAFGLGQPGASPADSNLSAWGAPAGTTYNAGNNTYNAPTGWGNW